MNTPSSTSTNGSTASTGATEQDVIAQGRRNVAELNRQQIVSSQIQTEFAKSQIIRQTLQASAAR